MKISIIVPCYNEVENIPLIHRAIAQCVGAIYDYEIVYVNDGSSDNSQNVLGKIYMSDSNHIRVINFSRNFGKEAAMYAGLKYATGDLVSIIDADMQQSPSYIVDMIEFLINHNEYDMVAMYQERRIEKKGTSFLKKRFYKVVNQLCEIDFFDGASDFRTFRRSVADALLELPENYRFSKGLFSWIGFNTYYMPYVANERANGQSKWSMRQLVKYAVGGILSFSTVPLKLALWLGLLFSFGTLTYMCIVIIQYFASAIEISGYATIVCLILLLGGIQLMILGIIGEYLAKTYMQGKHRPIYIIKEILIDNEADCCIFRPVCTICTVF